MQGHKRASGLYSHEQLEKQTKNKTKTEVEEGRGFEFQLQQSDIQSKWKEAQRNVTGLKLKKKQEKSTIRMCVEGEELRIYSPEVRTQPLVSPASFQNTMTERHYQHQVLSLERRYGTPVP